MCEEMIKNPYRRVWACVNLDALHDCLTDITEPTELVIRGGVVLETALGGYYKALRRVLADCAVENGAFSVVWEE